MLRLRARLVTSGPPGGPAAVARARRAGRNRSLLRDGMVVLLVAIGLVVAWSVRLIDNPDRPLAETLTATMDATFRAERSGQLTLGPQTTAVADGIEGLHLDAGTDVERWVLTGRAGSDCYAMWWDVDGCSPGPHAAVHPAVRPVEPRHLATHRDLRADRPGRPRVRAPGPDGMSCSRTRRSCARGSCRP